jgi:hypothetical protein
MDDNKPVTRADLAELETRLRNDALAAVDRHVDALETRLHKSIADMFQSHTQLLETVRDGVQEIRSFMAARSQPSTRSSSQTAPRAGVAVVDHPVARAVNGAPGLDLRDRARIVVYEAYEVPTERLAGLTAEQRAELDSGMARLEAFIAHGDSDLDELELTKLIQRVGSIIRPPAPELASSPRKAKFMGSGKSARGARKFF